MAGNDKPAEFIWQDREIRFDSNPKLLACRTGEKEIDSINSVEDTKGNNGERGSMIVTNLRILWVAHSNSKINLSIGLNSIVSVNIRKAKSKLRGTTQALCVLAKSTSRYEFIFTSLVKNSPRLFTTVQAVMRAYETSKLYRDLKLRGSIIRDGDLLLLPAEQVYTRINGVWNLSGEQGNLGTFIMTNVRIVWHAHTAANFNVSIPYMQIRNLRLRESKFGRALVIETFKAAGGYILGFRMDPAERLEEVRKLPSPWPSQPCLSNTVPCTPQSHTAHQAHTEMKKLWDVFTTSPIFGVQFSFEGETPSLDRLLQPRVEEDTELVEDEEDVHAVAAYYADGATAPAAEDGAGGHAEPLVYDGRLGLAVEAMQDGVTIESLWRVV